MLLRAGVKRRYGSPEMSGTPARTDSSRQGVRGEEKKDGSEAWLASTACSSMRA